MCVCVAKNHFLTFSSRFVWKRRSWVACKLKLSSTFVKEHPVSVFPPFQDKAASRPCLELDKFMMLAKRGVLIVFEGCDKAGKTTQTRLLLEALQKLGKSVQLIRFPDRTTPMGDMIDKYLSCKADFQDEVIHLLFSANRWEMVPKINKLLSSGESVIVDRYAFSGAAFTAAKGLNLDWCKGPDVGLPKPDIVLFLNVSKEEASGRGGYGDERYENLEFQEKVKHKFLELYDDTYWKTVETGRPIDEVHRDILSQALETLESKQRTALKKLWA